MKVKGYYPLTLDIDGSAVRFRLKRLTDTEFAWFAHQGAQADTPAIQQFVTRGASTREQARDEKGAYVVPFEQLCEERLEAMTGDERAQFLEAAAAADAEAQQFVREAFQQFVTIEADDISEETDDGEQPVTDGLAFLRLFGARKDVILVIMAAIRQENMLDATAKKASPSRAASPTGSRRRPRGQRGPRRRTTAARAATGGSARTGGATTTDSPPAPGRAPSSGSAATSGPPAAPSGN